MAAGMEEILNPGLDADHTNWVPVQVEVEIVESWGDQGRTRRLTTGAPVRMATSLRSSSQNSFAYAVRLSGYVV
jgi:hypothetical protein